jgi:hypothetical protein
MARGEEEVMPVLYRAEGGRGKGAEACGWRRIEGGEEGARGRGEAPGDRGGGRRWPAAKEEGRRPEVGDDPDRWAPPVGGRVRERGRGVLGRAEEVGRKLS